MPAGSDNDSRECQTAALTASGKSLVPFRAVLSFTYYDAYRLLTSSSVEHTVQERCLEHMSKLEHGTERMVARCITLDVQGGESRSFGKMMT